MARIERVAGWIASDILRERGVEKTAASMSAVLPVAYVLATGVMKALSELSAEMAGELAAATAVIRFPVLAGSGFAETVTRAFEEHQAEWESEFSRSDPDSAGGV